MKKITIVFTIIFIIVVSTILSNYLSKNELDFISNLSTLITLAGTIITLIIALILYNQLGLDQAILQKKAEVVFGLLDMLSKRSFTVNTSTGVRLLIWLTSISKNKLAYQQYGDIKLLFDKEYIDSIQPIVDLGRNVFLPTEILPKIQALEAYVFVSANSKITEREYAKVIPARTFKEDESAIGSSNNLSKDDWGILISAKSNNTETTLSQFISEWDDLIRSSTLWIANNSSYQDMNIPFFRTHLRPSQKSSLLKKFRIRR